jgi:predicted transcriptional regulator
MSKQEIANRLGLRQAAVSIATRWGKKWQGRKSIFVCKNSNLYIYGRPG